MKIAWTLLVAVGLLAGCTETWETQYDAPLESSVSSNWRLAEVVVDVPTTLSVSEENTFAPDADIVWREESLTPGVTRFDQVDEIMTEAITLGASGLSGSVPVRIEARVATFHALSQRARYNLNASGVHNITYILQVFDARSLRALTEPMVIRADFAAYVGDRAVQAEAAGLTQRVRITRHVAETTAGYLGIAPDNRESFTRLGR